MRKYLYNIGTWSTYAVELYLNSSLISQFLTFFSERWCSTNSFHGRETLPISRESNQTVLSVFRERRFDNHHSQNTKQTEIALETLGFKLEYLSVMERKLFIC